MKKVCIIGAGMAGLLSAKACLDNGIEPSIFSSDGYTSGYGVRYLHDNCGLPIKPIKIETAFVGYGMHFLRWDEADKSAMSTLYAMKTGASARNNSIHRSEKFVEAYDWAEAFNMLHGFRIEKKTIVPSDMAVLQRLFDLVICTAPLPILFPQFSKLCHERILWVSDDSPSPYQGGSWRDGEDNIIVYNVDSECEWVRYSRICGKDQTEWLRSESHKGAHPVRKIDGCAGVPNKQGNILLVGRYGLWNSTYMAHQAYYDVINELKAE